MKRFFLLSTVLLGGGLLSANLRQVSNISTTQKRNDFHFGPVGKISILIDGAYTELAVRTLHSVYGLDKH